MSLDPAIRPAPRWIRLAAAAVRRLPAGRYRATSFLARWRVSPFIARLPFDAGGYEFVCDFQDAIAREVCLTGRYEPLETALVKDILKPGMTFVDVGANWGYFTLLAAHCVGPVGRVVALEPHPELFDRLHDNVRLNGLAHVTPLNVAASDRSGPGNLVRHEPDARNSGLSFLRPPGQIAAGTDVAVRSLPLDDVFSALSLTGIDLLKIDIEGGEGAALNGLSASLTSRIARRLLLELHPARLAEFGLSVGAILRCLRRAGYRGWTVDHSVSATRRAAYRKSTDIRDMLTPVDAEAVLDSWPHQIWFAPDVEPIR